MAKRKLVSQMTPAEWDEARVMLGVTRREFARCLGIAPQTEAKYRKGRQVIPTTLALAVKGLLFERAEIASGLVASQMAFAERIGHRSDEEGDDILEVTEETARGRPNRKFREYISRQRRGQNRQSPYHS